MLIWKRITQPFVMGGSVNRKAKTEISDDLVKPVDLGKGFKGFVLEHDGKTGVYELTSGGLVGDTLEDVKADIDTCDDPAIIQAQIDKAVRERDEARLVSNELYFSYH